VTHGEGPVARAEAIAAEQSAPQQPLGRPLDQRSLFFVGMIGATGVAATYLLVQLLLPARTILILVGLAVASPMVARRRASRTGATNLRDRTGIHAAAVRCGVPHPAGRS